MNTNWKKGTTMQHDAFLRNANEEGIGGKIAHAPHTSLNDDVFVCVAKATTVHMRIIYYHDYDYSIEL